MRIHITTTKRAVKPKTGDEKIVKGVTMVRQQVYSKLHRAYVVSNGRPVWEWVVKGGVDDRNKRPSPDNDFCAYE